MAEATVDAILDGPRVRRKYVPKIRNVQACVSCRERKIKCGKEKPVCRKCANTKRTCTYASLLSENTSVKSTPSSLARPDLDTSAVEGAVLRGNNDSRYVGGSSWLSDGVPNHSFVGDYFASGQLRNIKDATRNAEKLTAAAHELVRADPAERGKTLCWFLDHCLFYLPVLDADEVRQMYTDCLSREVEDVKHELVLISAICYTAESSIDAYRPGVGHETPANDWLRLTLALLEVHNFPQQPHIHHIRAAILLSHVHITEGSVLPDPSLTAKLVRAAQGLGLHRDPTFLGFLSKDIDRRRKLFWLVAYQDLTYATHHGLPPLIHRSSYNVQAPTEIDSPLTLFLTARVKSTFLAEAILTGPYGAHPLSTGVIQRLCKDTAQFVSWSTEQAAKSRAGLSAQHQFVAYCIEMMAARMTFTLHQTYLRGYYPVRDSRQVTLKSAALFIRHYRSMCSDFICAPFQWIIDFYNIFHPCAIILQDLVRHPGEYSGDDLREVIESAFEAFFDEEDANWRRLQALKNKAWSSNHWSSPAVDDMTDSIGGLSDWDALFGSFVANETCGGESPAETYDYRSQNFGIPV